MNIVEIYGIMLFFIAVFIIINDKYFRLPQAIGITLMAIFVSLLCVLLEWTNLLRIDHSQITFLNAQVFSRFVLNGVLMFLLFAGSFHINVKTLKKEARLIGWLSSVSVILATLIFGGLSYLLLPKIGLKVDFSVALILGALIAPTDPIAVLNILKNFGLSKKLDTLISGESLFNDGAGYAVFIILLELAIPHGSTTLLDLLLIIMIEILGGLSVGLLFGVLVSRLLKVVKEGSGGIMISLAAITTLLILSTRLGFSGPLSAVSFGIYLSTQRHTIPILSADKSEFYVFWSVLDTLMNSMLFLLLGLEVAVIHYDMTLLIGSLVVIFIGLLSRFISVFIPLIALNGRKILELGTLNTSYLLTWGGLRGGLSLALVMSLPDEISHNYFITLTYSIVIFSIVIQGLSVGKLYKRMVS